MKAFTSKLCTIVLATLIASCGNGANKVTESADSLMAKADTAMDKVKAGAEKVASDVEASISKNEDSNFVVKAALANNAELKILQAGIDKGTDKGLKAHAKMMLSDHKKLGEKVKSYAAGKNYILPEGDEGKGDDAIANLDKNTAGKDWDKAWTDYMVTGHEDAIALFEKGEKNVKDEGLRKIIDATLPTLHSHLDMMKSLQDKLGK